jgi:hypothetical protein
VARDHRGVTARSCLAQRGDRTVGHGGVRGDREEGLILEAQRGLPACTSGLGIVVGGGEAASAAREGTEEREESERRRTMGRGHASRMRERRMRARQSSVKSARCETRVRARSAER